MNEIVKTVKVIKAVYIKNRINNMRAYPFSFMLSRILRAAFMIGAELLIFNFVFQRQLSNEFMEKVGYGDYLSFIVLGQTLSVISFAILMNVGRCLISEVREGTIDCLILSPASRVGYYIGAYIEQFFRSLAEGGCILIIGYIFGMRIPIYLIPRLIVVVLLSSVAFFAVSISVATIMLYTRDTYLVQNTLYLVMEFVCGVLYPIGFMRVLLQKTSKIFPLTYALELFRNCVLGGETIRNNLETFVLLLVISIGYAAAGFWFYKKLERNLIEEVFI